MPFDGATHFGISASAQTTPVSRSIFFGEWSLSAYDRIRELSRLPQNWDQRNTPGIASDAREVSLKLVESLAKIQAPKPHIVPVSGGGLQFEWYTTTKDLEIEIAPNGSATFLATDKLNGDEMVTGDISDVEVGDDLLMLLCWMRSQKTGFEHLISYAHTD